jgi:hypothetical protein
LSREDRREVLRVYKSIFPVVDYDPETGVCKCFKKQRRVIDLKNGSTGILQMDGADPIKVSTLLNLA